MMNPPVSLRSLDETAYVLLGIVLPDDGTGGVEVVVAPDKVDRYPETARPILEYLSVPRRRSKAVADLARWDAEESDLDHLVDDGVLVRLPAQDEAGVRAAIGTLALGVTAPTKLAPDGKSLLLNLPNERAVVMSPLTIAVLNSPTLRSLGEGVEAVARESNIPRDQVWRRLLVDLTGILGTGAGHLTKTGEAP